MLSVQMEQRVKIKFLVKLEKTFSEAYVLLKEVYAHKFLNGLNDFKRGVKRPTMIRASDGPQRQKTDENIEKN
ncbi:hypothetical protein NQ318_002857 [Aromia moschata]|uniref:Uncharacterized protein n=1 Tax=Aromia moschata TaxID=1265417 RepID=A0AAV8XTY8_9CUCU|nr:hypothetical protein NQ318_002857 [Aromia moschata]